MDKPERKPLWLKTAQPVGNAPFIRTRDIVRTHSLNTICTSGKCPNRGECWSRGTATFMIGGEICTRSCRFCNTITGRPFPLDPDEPRRVAESISLMNLRYAVVTSVDRDDLPDGGANHWAETIRAIRIQNPRTLIETLIPDFSGKAELIDIVLTASPNVVSHNLETVRRLTPLVRSAAKYETSLSVLSRIAERGVAKTGIMVGLGETDEEVQQTMDDALRAGVKILTIGQYLRPSKANLPVSEYVHPRQFDEWKRIALDKGFERVESAPLVRSSYRAGDSYTSRSCK